MRYALEAIEFRHTNAKLHLNEMARSEAERTRTLDARRNVLHTLILEFFGNSISRVN